MNHEYHIKICNQVQDEMAKKFGWFTMMFLFWIPKYDKWYQDRIKELELENCWDGE